MENCWIILATPDLTEDRTIPSGDRRSLAAFRSRGWVPVRIIRANLPWPARQLLVTCTHGHTELTH
jgi:hypothetical protein